MNEYEIINNALYKLYIEYDPEEIDYYKAVKLYLQYGCKKILIADDNILFYYNVFNSYTQNTDSFILDEKLEPDHLGKQLNEYYNQMWNEQIYQDIILGEGGRWIGERYCCFETNDRATWIYKYNDKLYLLVTELYNGFGNIYNPDFFTSYLENYGKYIFKSEIEIDELFCLRDYFKALTQKYIG